MLQSNDDIAELVSQAFSHDGALLVHETELGPAFFDLRTRLAGELFQKFMNYGLRLAIVVAKPEQYGERFRELAFEHRNHGNIRFFPDAGQAGQWLTRAAHRNVSGGTT